MLSQHSELLAVVAQPLPACVAKRFLVEGYLGALFAVDSWEEFRLGLVQRSLGTGPCALCNNAPGGIGHLFAECQLFRSARITFAQDLTDYDRCALEFASPAEWCYYILSPSQPLQRLHKAVVFAHEIMQVLREHSVH